MQCANTMNRDQSPRPWWRWQTSLELVAVIYGIFAVIVLWVSDPTALRQQHLPIAIALIPACVLAPVGGWWAVYQSIRYEKAGGAPFPLGHNTSAPFSSRSQWVPHSSPVLRGCGF